MAGIDIHILYELVRIRTDATNGQKVHCLYHFPYPTLTLASRSSMAFHHCQHKGLQALTRRGQFQALMCCFRPRRDKSENRSRPEEGGIDDRLSGVFESLRRGQCGAILQDLSPWVPVTSMQGSGALYRVSSSHRPGIWRAKTDDGIARC